MEVVEFSLCRDSSMPLFSSVRRRWLLPLPPPVGKREGDRDRERIGWEKERELSLLLLL